MKHISILIISSVLFFSGCSNSHQGKPKEIIVFHAGSLSVPLGQLREEYEKLHPDIRILLEPAGSIVCARKITELRKPCDLIASADYFVINELLIPEYTNWSVRFATNEIVIAYSDKSKYASEINSDNWTDILLKDDVIFSRSDPDADPCGYRAVFSIMLMEKLHGKPGLTKKLLSKNRDFIRPKEVDLVALIEANAADYMFQYKSVAIQHNLRFLELPDDVNLSVPENAGIYQSVSLEVAGQKPGTTMKVIGDYINYSLSVLDKAPARNEALDFACFILSERGMEIFRRNGQNPIKPFSTEQPDQLPPKIHESLTGKKSN
jgi:molybdate/tungstate transport system substrate-binding protein